MLTTRVHRTTDRRGHYGARHHRGARGDAREGPGVPASERKRPLDLEASFLTTLRFVKTANLQWTREASPEVLEVSGRPDLLAIWAEDFLFDVDDAQGHHHPEFRSAQV